ncbi:MAG: 6-carboxytetrahydropterin synthase [Dehalococcoidia bacterium]|jgi:6-pyruvoyltetrahydropterin/6-carboxytetrahydropterin synthase|nr:6-carboxytetrahydropterin synthase [Dehalococcoidia bacterium]
MTEQRNVTVEGVRLRFAAAHMATLGDEFEPLHGHNYAVRCCVDGDLTDDRWVIDFSLLKRYVREACERLDHRFLLQLDSPLLDINEDGGNWTIAFGDRSYRFPSSDVAALPIENTTAELLAEWIGGQVVQSLTAGDHGNITAIAVDVEEMPGQSGGYSRDLAD